MTNRLAATVVLMVATFMDLMDSTITNVALPAISATLEATPAQLEWTLAGYVIAFATLLITGGRLGDIFGRRSIFLIGVIGFTVASGLASLAWSGDMLVTTRVVQGAFAGIMVPQVLSSVQVMFAPEERGPIFGVVGALSAIGAIAGLLLGGWLVTADVLGTGWRSIFLINVPVGILLVAATVLFVPNSRSEHPVGLDLAGVALGALAVFLVVFPLTDGRAAGWAWWIWMMLVAAPFAIGLFIRQQRRKLSADGTALLPLPLFQNRGFSSGLLVQVVSSVGNGGYSLVLLFYMQAALGFTAFSAGLALLPIGIGSMIGTPVAMLIMKRLGKQAVLLGGALQAAAFGWVMMVIKSEGSDLSGWSLTPALTVAGIGMMVLIMPQTSIALDTVPTSEAGAASGTFTTFGQVGMVLGVALAGAVYFGEISDTSDAQAAVTAGLWVIIAAYALAGIAALTMPSVQIGSKEDGET